MASFRCYDNSYVIGKNLGNLQEFFGQMDYRTAWQEIARTPMVEYPRACNLSFKSCIPQTSFRHASFRAFLYVKMAKFTDYDHIL